MFAVGNVLSFDAKGLKRSDQESRFRGELDVPMPVL